MTSVEGALQARRSFGLLFFGVAAAVTAGALLGELAIENHLPVFYQAGIWLASFGVTFALIMPKFRKAIPAIRSRMRQSMHWSTRVKAINGLCWAAPFAAIGAAPYLYQYLILLGIGLGNLSTYFFLKKFSGLNNPEQLLVGVISLAALPVAALVDSSLLSSRQDLALMVSRLLIAVAYGAAAAFALNAKGNTNSQILKNE